MCVCRIGADIVLANVYVHVRNKPKLNEPTIRDENNVNFNECYDLCGDFIKYLNGIESITVTLVYARYAKSTLQSAQHTHTHYCSTRFYGVSISFGPTTCTYTPVRGGGEGSHVSAAHARSHSNFSEFVIRTSEANSSSCLAIECSISHALDARHLTQPIFWFTASMRRLHKHTYYASVASVN